MAVVTALAEALLDDYRRCGATLSTAESCTSGLIAATLGEVAGASLVLLGGVIAYANSAKINLLDVDAAILSKQGAVSLAVAAQMAIAARRLFASTIAISVTGIAGPAGGSAEKPVGTVYIGIASPLETSVKPFLFTGDRRAVREQTVEQALRLARQTVLHLPAQVFAEQ
jgi:PncC family amidohydrolase